MNEYNKRAREGKGKQVGLFTEEKKTDKKQPRRRHGPDAMMNK